MNIHTPQVTEAELATAITEAIELGKKDARAGLEPKGPDEMPEGLEVAWDAYEEAWEAEMVVIGGES
ncbi:MAG TPA: hypothetical protein VL494_13425 [Steroidobacteraceae bacterium]|jgi:hypothetical protein|nr:hypothetical protein [Steroidobacteraceae bacterium]